MKAAGGPLQHGRAQPPPTGMNLGACGVRDQCLDFI